MPDEKDKSNGEDKDYTPEFDVVEEGADKQPVKDKDDKSAKPAGYKDDERLSASQREEEDPDDGEVEVEADKGDQTAEEIEAKRERRRRERRAQKARQVAARARDDREMHYLRTRNEQLERAQNSLAQRVTNNEVVQVDGRIEQLKLTRAEAEDTLARAIEANNGHDVVKLQRTIGELNEGIGRLTRYKVELGKEHKEPEGGGEQQGQEGQQPRQPQLPPPSVMKNLQVFGQRHSWFDPNGKDEESRVVLALDAAVKEEGFDPASKDYWIELEERMAKRLPERMTAFKGTQTPADEDGDKPQPRNGSKAPAKANGGPRMSSGSQTRGSGKQFLLSAERRQAMVEAGVWDDLKLRDKYLRSYAAWDKDHPAS
jgi:hypothetical protein